MSQIIAEREQSYRMPTLSDNAGEKINRLFALLVPLVVILLILGVYGIRYTTNDDATLANIAAGAYGPDRLHLIYVNVLFGCLLRPFYLLVNGVNWYVLLQLALVWGCCAALLRLAMEKIERGCALCLFFAVALPFALYYVYRFQYVKVSGLCVTAGLVLMADSLGKREKQRRTALGIFFALMGSLLRFDMFCAVGGLSAAVLLGRFFSLDKQEKRRAAAAMLVLFGLVFGAKGVDSMAYRLDDGWNAYQQYNAARTDFSDYKTQLLPEENIFADAGVSDNDYAILKRWDYYDGTVFPAERVQQLADQVEGKAFWRAVKDTVKVGLSLLYGVSYRYVLPLLVLIGMILLKWNRRFLPFLGTVVILGCEVFYLTWKDRMPSYVEIPLLLATVLLLCAAMGQAEWRFGAVRLRQTAALLAVLVLLSAPTYRAILSDSRSYRQWATAEQSYFEAMSADKENLYLLSTESINVAAGLDVWNPRPEDFYSNIVAYGGWLSHAPHREAALAAYGLTDPLTDAVDRPNVYLSYHGVQTAVTYAAEHLGVAVEAVSCGENAFAPYQFRRVE